MLFVPIFDASWCFMMLIMFPLLWKITIFNGKIHYKWPFSIAMLNYQRVNNAITWRVNPPFSDAPRFVRGGVATLAVFDAGKPSSKKLGAKTAKKNGEFLRVRSIFFRSSTFGTVAVCPIKIH